MVDDVATILGGPEVLKSSPKDSLEWVYLIRRGLPKQSLIKLVEFMGLFTAQAVAFLPISQRTIQRYTDDDVYNKEISEHLVLIAELFQKGIDVFGSKELFKEWLELPLFALGGKIPISLLDTVIGIELIEDELLRLEYGVIS